MQAKDIMTPKVISVSPETGVGEIAELLMEHGISAVPVLGSEKELLGIVSEGDLIRRLSAEADEKRPWWVRFMSSRADDARDFIKAHGRTARDVMTRNVITVGDDAALSEVAHQLESNRVKSVPVLRDGKVVGIVSRSNLLQTVARQKAETPSAVTPNDREIRRQVHDRLTEMDFSSHGTMNVIVEDGIVELWGWVESDAEREALRLAASEVEGVREVRDHFGRVSPWVWGA